MYSESSECELKRELVDGIKNEIIAFLNTKGGTIYVGVNDDGSLNQNFIEQNKDDNLLIVSSWVQDAFYPIPSSFIDFGYNKDNVLVIQIREGNKKPYYLKDKGPKPSGVYKRVGTSIRKCNEDEILRLIMESNHYDFESDVSENQDLTFKYFNELCDERKIDNSKKQKISLGLIKANGTYTNLGLLISDQSPIAVKIAEYDDYMNFKIKKTFTGSLLKVLIDTQEQSERMNDVSAVIDPSSWQRIETKSYPGESLREIILNAFCHCNYFIRSNIRIEFYKDKAKITSPGGLYKTSLDEMLRGVQTYRNERLVHLLDKLGFIENFGTGIPRTLSAYSKSKKKPEFYDSENFFIVYLPNLNYEEINNDQISGQINDQINDQIKETISDLGLEVMKFIQKNPGTKVPMILSELSKTFENLTVDKIRNVIKREIKNYIELRGSKKTGGYYIKEANYNASCKDND